MTNFEISTASMQEVYEKLSIKLFLYEKLKDIDFSVYTNSFNRIYAVFQCFPKDIKSRKVLEYKTMRRKTKTLELYLILDYERIMQGTDEENLQHIKEVFLKGCETFLKPLKEFKWKEFNEVIKRQIY